ncbi:hypothetical protein BZA70DRAFT_274596 [Myxozyma melibiosi]|uniref:Histone deacetylase complex subunit SAP30 Sin3 binding domain-containing protein n=1 Tax=Myxozyma melibiosi TaxID=54550 RepID=A0ABR1F9Q2_9ASCO
MAGPSHHASSRVSHAAGAASGKRGAAATGTAAAIAAANAGAATANAAGVDEAGVPIDPVNFDTFPDDALRKYRASYSMPDKSSISNLGMLLNGKVGQRTYSYKHRNRITKEELAGAVKRHFIAQPAREVEMIAGFFYAVRHQNETLKLKFPLP